MSATVATLIAALTISCIATLVLTALVRRVAIRVGFTDRPDGHRKLHSRPTPLGGGVVVFLVTASVVGALLLVPTPWRTELRGASSELLGLLLAGAVIVIVGLADDRVSLRGRQKVVGQLVAASILILSGLLIQDVGIFERQIELGLLAVPVTLFWLLGAINAVNLLDGIDGLATMLGLILAATIAGMAAISGHSEVVIISLVFAGSLLGFLRFNFPPARIFLGDSGSMLIGLVVGALAIHGSLKGAGTALLAAPLAVWVIPILDTTAAIVRRKLTGRSVYITDRGHMHHRLLDRLGTTRRVLSVLAAFCMLASAGALACVFWKNDLIALLSCCAVTTIFLVTNLFGRSEVVLVARHVGKAGRSLIPFGSARKPKTRESIVRLQGSREWKQVWDVLTESADRLSLSKIHLNVNVPVAHEGFNATWERPWQEDPERDWQFVIPLTAGDQPIGHLTVAGRSDGESVAEHLEQLRSLLVPFQAQLGVCMQHELVLAPGNDPTGVKGNGSQNVPDLIRRHPK